MMKLTFALTERGAALQVDGRPWIEDIGLELTIAGRRYSTLAGTLKRAGSWPLAGEDKLGHYRGLGLVYSLETTELLELRLKAYMAMGWALIELEALQELDGTAVADSFLQTTGNLIFHLQDGRFLLYTWGLRHANELGRWPEGVVGQSLRDMPEEPFAPFVLWSDNDAGALALAPANYFLTSPLRPWPGPAERPEDEDRGAEPAIAHGFQGAVKRIPQGTIRRTAVAFVEQQDPVAALYSLGDLLLRLSGKRRPGPLADLLLKHLSYWNDYGAYYSHPFNPIDGRILSQLAEYFHDKNIPVGYFGLDLWYHFDRVGWATRYEPDRERFPRGLGAIVERTGLPFLLHLSAFARDFVGNKHKFIVAEQASHPAEPRRFYRDLGRRLKYEEGACGIWHDWLWVQQGSVKELRADPELAERWFSEMATAFREEDLPLLLCMPTMGFHLAATQHQNAIAARSYCDYLNTQPGQVERARALGLEAESIPVQRYLKQNLLVGLALHALGSYPFYDIFITNRKHPEGFAEPRAEQKALFCALSAGPVGIGDKLGFIDEGIIERLTFPDGRLAKPDRPPWPLPDSLDREMIIAQSATEVGELHWRYLLLANVGEARAESQLELHKLFPDEEFIVYDCLEGQVLERAEISTDLGPADIAGYLLAPRRAGLALLGLRDRYVPLPHGLLTGLQISEGEWQLQLQLSPGYNYPLLIWCAGGKELEAAAEGAEIVSLTRQGEIYELTLQATAASVELALRAR